MFDKSELKVKRRRLKFFPLFTPLLRQRGGKQDRYIQPRAHIDNAVGESDLFTILLLSQIIVIIIYWDKT